MQLALEVGGQTHVKLRSNTSGICDERSVRSREALWGTLEERLAKVEHLHYQLGAMNALKGMHEGKAMQALDVK